MMWFAGVGHFGASALLWGIHWDRVGRRLASLTFPVLAGYALFSIAFLLLLAWLSRKEGFGGFKQIVAAALIPYLSAVLGYLGAFAFSDRAGAMVQHAGIFSVLGVAAVFPYFVLWGPAVSAVNAASFLLWHGIRAATGGSR